MNFESMNKINIQGVDVEVGSHFFSECGDYN